MSQVIVADFSAGGDAQVAAAMLRASGVECRMTTDDLGGMVPALAMSNPVSLIVVESDVSDARAILGDLALATPRMLESAAPYTGVVLTLVGIAVFLTALLIILAN